MTPCHMYQSLEISSILKWLVFLFQFVQIHVFDILLFQKMKRSTFSFSDNLMSAYQSRILGRRGAVMMRTQLENVLAKRNILTFNIASQSPFTANAHRSSLTLEVCGSLVKDASKLSGMFCFCQTIEQGMEKMH